MLLRKLCFLFFFEKNFHPKLFRLVNPFMFVLHCSTCVRRLRGNRAVAHGTFNGLQMVFVVLEIVRAHKHAINVPNNYYCLVCTRQRPRHRGKRFLYPTRKSYIDLAVSVSISPFSYRSRCFRIDLQSVANVSGGHRSTNDPRSPQPPTINTLTGTYTRVYIQIHVSLAKFAVFLVPRASLKYIFFLKEGKNEHF